MHIYTTLPLLTDFPTRQQWEAAVWEILTNRLAQVSTGEDVRQILGFLISPTHRRSILYRALTASRLASGIGTREISRELWITRQTIGAIKHSLAERSYQSARTVQHNRPRRKAGKK